MASILLLVNFFFPDNILVPKDSLTVKTLFLFLKKSNSKSIKRFLLSSSKVNFCFSIIKPTVGPELDKDIGRAVQKIRKGINKAENIAYLRSVLKGKLMNINYVGLPLFPFFHHKLVMDSLEFNYKEKDSYTLKLFNHIKNNKKFNISTDEEVFDNIEQWLKILYAKEREKNFPYWMPEQITDDSFGDLSAQVEDEMKEKLIYAFRIRFFTTSWIKTNFAYNTGIYIINLLQEIHSLGIDEHFMVTLTDNKFKDHNSAPYPNQIYEAYKGCQGEDSGKDKETWKKRIRVLFPDISEDDAKALVAAGDYRAAPSRRVPCR